MASGAPSVPSPLRARASRSSARESPSRVKPEKDPLLRFDSPSEYCRGALPERPSPLLPPAFAGARVRLSWGSSSLRRDHSGCPALPRSVTRPREAKGASPSPGSALGVPPPLGGLSRAGVRRARVAPLPPLQPSLRPGAPRPCFMPRASLGFTLQSFPLPRSRAAARRPLLPCGFRADRESPARRAPGCPTAFGRATRRSRAWSPP